MISPVVPHRDRASVDLLDQTRLPHEQRWLTLRSVGEVAAAIREMRVRGAPAIGFTAGFGIALALERFDGSLGALPSFLEESCAQLLAARPTAVNLAWAVGRMAASARAFCADGRLSEARDAAWHEAQALFDEDLAACRAIGACGALRLRNGGSYLTHCNTGALATAGWGTALGVFRTAHQAGKALHVFVDETRPWLQGARLTAWELKEEGIPCTLLCDGAAASLMGAGSVEAVIVGADRITCDGSVANKIGTYNLAILCRYFGIPFFVAAPRSTFDNARATGADIVIEQRDPSEVTHFAGNPVAPVGTPAWNPAFDVTPPALVTAFFTDGGELLPPFAQSLSSFLGRSGRR
jgi:methylthioribose-1-phosphate isomerase